MKNLKTYDSYNSNEFIFYDAFENGWTDIAKKLSRQFSDDQQILNTACGRAIKGNKLELIKYLVENHNVDPTTSKSHIEYGGNPFLYAWFTRKYDIVLYLLDFPQLDVLTDSAAILKHVLHKLDVFATDLKFQSVLKKIVNHPNADKVEIVKKLKQDSTYFEKDMGGVYFKKMLIRYYPEFEKLFDINNKFDVF